MRADPTPTSLEPRGDVDVLDTPEAGPRTIRGAVLRVGSYLAGGLLGLVSAPLVVRHLGVVDFGRYATVVSLLALVAGVTEGGLGPVGVREYATLTGAERERFMRNLLGLRIALTGAGVGLAVLFAAVAGYGPQLVAGTAVGGLGLLVDVSQSTLAVALYTRLEVGRQVAAELLKQVLSVGLIAVLVLLGAGVLPFLAVPIPSGLMLLAITAALVGSTIPFRPAFAPREWRVVLRETLPVGAAVAVQALYFRSVIIVMSLVASGLETGYFATSYRLVEILIGIPVLVVGTAYPVLVRAAQSDRQRLDYVVGRLFDVAVIGGTWLAACTAIGAPLAIAIIAGSHSEPSVAVLRIQGVTLVLTFLSALFGTSLLALRQHGRLVAVSGSALVLTAVLALVLVGPVGARGGAIATAAGETVLAVLTAAFLRRAAPEVRVSLRVVPRVALAGALAAAASVPLPVPDAARLVVFTAIYAATLAALRAIPWEVRDALRPQG